VFRSTLATSVRVDRCQEFLRESALPQDLRTAGDDALEDAREANELRNRVVHDAWIKRMKAPDGPEFNRVRIGKAGLIDQPSDLDFVHDAEQRLDQPCGRVKALVKAMDLLRNAAGKPVPEDLSYQRMLPAIGGEPQPEEDE
jgi:hypothetical protein